MALKKGYLHKKNQVLHLSKKNFLIGIALGLSFSFIFYFFLKFSREIFRLFSGLLYQGELYVLDDQTLFLYNFFYALLAVLFAQSIVFIYWFDKPKRFFSKYSYKRKSMLNDYRLTTWYFMFWFSKVGVTLGLISIFYPFINYKEYKFLIVLLVIVLFLQTRLTYRRVYKNKGLRWMIISMISMLFISLVLSKISIIDFKRIDTYILEQNMLYKYKIHVPKSKTFKRISHSNLLLEAFVTHKYLEKSTPIIIIINSKEITIEQLSTELKKTTRSLMKEEIPLLVFKLYISSNVEMKYIVQIKKELIKNGIRDVVYAIQPYNQDIHLPYYHHNNFIFDRHIIFSEQDILSSKYRIDSIGYSKNHKFLFNSKEFTKQSFLNKIKAVIKDNPKYLFVVKVDETLSFTDYFNILNTLNEGIYELRNKYSKEVYSIEYKQLVEEARHIMSYSESIKDINQRYPLNIVEKVER